MEHVLHESYLMMKLMNDENYQIIFWLNVVLCSESWIERGVSFP